MVHLLNNRKLSCDDDFNRNKELVDIRDRIFTHPKYDDFSGKLEFRTRIQDILDNFYDSFLNLDSILPAVSQARKETCLMLLQQNIYSFSKLGRIAEYTSVGLKPLECSRDDMVFSFFDERTYLLELLNKARDLGDAESINLLSNVNVRLSNQDQYRLGMFLLKSILKHCKEYQWYYSSISIIAVVYSLSLFLKSMSAFFSRCLNSDPSETSVFDKVDIAIQEINNREKEVLSLDLSTEGRRTKRDVVCDFLTKDLSYFNKSQISTLYKKMKEIRTSLNGESEGSPSIESTVIRSVRPSLPKPDTNQSTVKNSSVSDDLPSRNDEDLTIKKKTSEKENIGRRNKKIRKRVSGNSSKSKSESLNYVAQKGLTDKELLKIIKEVILKNTYPLTYTKNGLNRLKRELVDSELNTFNKLKEQLRISKNRDAFEKGLALFNKGLDETDNRQIKLLNHVSKLPKSTRGPLKSHIKKSQLLDDDYTRFKSDIMTEYSKFLHNEMSGLLTSDIDAFKSRLVSCPIEKLSELHGEVVLKKQEHEANLENSSPEVTISDRRTLSLGQYEQNEKAAIESIRHLIGVITDETDPSIAFYAIQGLVSRLTERHRKRVTGGETRQSKEIRHQTHHIGAMILDSHFRGPELTDSFKKWRAALSGQSEGDLNVTAIKKSFEDMKDFCLDTNVNFGLTINVLRQQLHDIAQLMQSKLLKWSSGANKAEMINEHLSLEKEAFIRVLMMIVNLVKDSELSQKRRYLDQLGLPIKGEKLLEKRNAIAHDSHKVTFSNEEIRQLIECCSKETLLSSH